MRISKDDLEIADKLAYERGKLSEYIDALAIFKKITEGCRDVINDNELHEDAKALAKLVIKDCKQYSWEIQ
jgi:hypothetical protein